MKFTAKTEYGLISLINLSKRYDKKVAVSLKELTQEEHYPKPFMEKIFRKLKRAGIVVAHPGKKGGFTLGRPPREINLKEILDALEGGTFKMYCEETSRHDVSCTHLCFCGMKPVWKKTKQLLDEFYAKMTLEGLSRNRAELDGITLAVDESALGGEHKP